VIDARAWLLWALAGMLAILSTRNPLYVCLLLLVALAVDRGTVALRVRRLPFRPLPLALFATVAGALFNALIARFGATAVFVIPAWLPLVAGPVTVEGLVYGATSGLELGTIYALFYVFNQVTAVHDLVRLAPRAFHEVGIVVSIALTFVPETTRAFERVREAQAVRGHQLRRVGDFLPIVVPLVVGSLERSTGLAEAMVARGYGAVAERAQPARLQALLAAGLALQLVGWLLFLASPSVRPVGAASLLLGALALAAALRLAGRAAPRTSYRARRWGWRDSAICLAVAAGLLLFLSGADHYSPYPSIAAPPFEPLVGLGVLLFLAPALVAPRR
jgi:energy-coupling factor transport system permease protein